MKASWICLALLLSVGMAGGVGAQIYKWVDKDGKVRYGDTPPPGSKTSPVKAPPPGAPAPAKDAKDGKKDKDKGPLTAAEREQDYRKRQEESRKAEEKADTESRAKADRADGCERAKEQLRTLDSGQRIARTNSSGERFFLDDNQVAQEVAKAQTSVQQACT